MESTIVVAEDFIGTLEIIKRTLERRGYKVLAARDGEEALKYFDGKEIHLLITDVEMPKINGFKLAQSVKGLQGYKNTPVMILSANRESEYETEIKTYKIDRWLRKPFDVKEFYDEVEQLIDSHKQT